MCPPLYLRVLPPRCFEQGDQASRLTKLGSEMGSTERRLSVYLQTELLLKLSKLLCLVPWFFMLPHPKPWLFFCSCTALAEFRSHEENHFVKTPSSAWTLHLSVPSPFFDLGTELTANPMSECGQPVVFHHDWRGRCLQCVDLETAVWIEDH